MSKIKYPDLRLEEKIVTSTRQIRRAVMDDSQPAKFFQQSVRSYLNSSGILSTGIILMSPRSDSFASEVSLKSKSKTDNLHGAYFEDSSLDDEEDGLENCGVYHIPQQSKVLFSEEIEIKTEELPRWQPKINIDRRMLENEDE